MKAECGDGSLVHPWECCATGGCNVFCCNCAGQCKKNQTDDHMDVFYVRRRSKREIGNENMELQLVRLIRGRLVDYFIENYMCSVSNLRSEKPKENKSEDKRN